LNSLASFRCVRSPLLASRKVAGLQPFFHALKWPSMLHARLVEHQRSLDMPRRAAATVAASARGTPSFAGHTHFLAAAPAQPLMFSYALPKGLGIRQARRCSRRRRRLAPAGKMPTVVVIAPEKELPEFMHGFEGLKRFMPLRILSAGTSVEGTAQLKVQQRGAREADLRGCSWGRAGEHAQSLLVPTWRPPGK
jgi:hypothetical protein